MHCVVADRGEVSSGSELAVAYGEHTNQISLLCSFFKYYGLLYLFFGCFTFYYWKGAINAATNLMNVMSLIIHFAL